jgi:hypothetical protein
MITPFQDPYQLGSMATVLVISNYDSCTTDLYMGSPLFDYDSCTTDLCMF